MVQNMFDPSRLSIDTMSFYTVQTLYFFPKPHPIPHTNLSAFLEFSNKHNLEAVLFTIESPQGQTQGYCSNQLIEVVSFKCLSL